MADINIRDDEEIFLKLLRSENEGQNSGTVLEFPQNPHDTQIMFAENSENNWNTESHFDKEGIYNNCIETGVIPKVKSEMTAAQLSGSMTDSAGLPQILDTFTCSSWEPEDLGQNVQRDKKIYSLHTGCAIPEVKNESTMGELPGLVSHVDSADSNTALWPTKRERHSPELLTQIQDPTAPQGEHNKSDSLHKNTNPLLSTNKKVKVLVIEPKQCMCQICHASTGTNVKLKVKSATTMECSNCEQLFCRFISDPKVAWFKCVKCPKMVKVGLISNGNPEKLGKRLYAMGKPNNGINTLQIVEIPIRKPVLSSSELSDIKTKLEVSDVLPLQNEGSPGANSELTKEEKNYYTNWNSFKTRT